MIGRKPGTLRAWSAQSPPRGPRPTKTGTAKQAPHHPVEWVRAYYHLAHRAGVVERFVEDVGRYYHDAEAIAASLRLEALMADHREPIADIIRRHPPAKFLAAAIPITFQEDCRCP
jgi:hypothetical protein